MKVMITGGAGYVGSRLTAHLLGRGFSIVVFDKLLYGGESLLPFLGSPEFSLVRGDVRDHEALGRALAGVDAVVHLAALVGEPACSIDEDQAWSINRGGTEVVLEAVRRRGVERLVFLSTCSNYGVANLDTLATEDTPVRPLSAYAKTKVDSELFLLEAGSPPASTVLRLGTICGLSARMRFDLLVSDMARLAAAGKTIDIFAPKAWRPFLHILDAARAIEHVLGAEPERVAGQVFNVVGENFQKVGLIELVRRHFATAEVAVTDKAPDLRDYRVDGSRIERELGFRTTMTVEDAFLEAANAVRYGVFRDPEWKGHSALPLDEAAFRSQLRQSQEQRLTR